MLVLPKMIGIPIFDAFEAGAVQAMEDFGINVIYTGPTTAERGRAGQDSGRLPQQRD